ncbi:MAG: hypothetical protein LUC83_07350 [Clostridiales bacterium]|nr:hypothetical protein [Clostridiales bacterium]
MNEEFYLAEEYVARYTKPSLYDCIALAVAKTRGIILLTGDGPLRKAAAAEGVEVMLIPPEGRGCRPGEGEPSGSLTGSMMEIILMRKNFIIASVN